MAEPDRRHALAGLAVAGRHGNPETDARPVRVELAALAHAWNIQGDARDPAFAEAAARVAGVALPRRVGSAAAGASGVVLCVGPASWLAYAIAAGGDAASHSRPDGSGSNAPASTPASSLAAAAAARDAIASAGGSLFDLGHARVAIRLAGIHAARVLAKGTGIDLHPSAFAEGECRSTAIARMQVVIVREAADRFLVLANRSYAASFWHWLDEAAREFGADVVFA